METGDNEQKAKEVIPDYVCCVLTEGTWTWFGAILVSLLLLLIAILKYCRKYLSKPKFESTNLTLLRKSLIVDDGDALGKIKLTPVKVEEFVKYCNTRRKHAIIDNLEFDKTSDGSDNKALKAAAQKNPRKNQNPAVVAQDCNRVILRGRQQESSNDYINASRLNAEYLDRSWIVTQGPMDHTVEDFWQMVWQEDTRLIVMLTKTFEVVRLMCSQYWPLHLKAKESYGEFEVELIKEERFAHYQVRHLKLTCCQGSQDHRIILQFHYLSWPLSAQPDSANLLLFRRHIRSQMDVHGSVQGPPLVHCHDGGGRSGTFLAIESNLSMAEGKGLVDILGCVKWLQAQRAQLVSHSGFYRLIYDVLEDFIKCGDTSLDIQDMMAKSDARHAPHPRESQEEEEGDAIELRASEFETLACLRPQYSIGDCAAGHRAENRDKNRNVLVVPPDDSRPYLTSFQNNSTTDYINAVFVDGFCQAKAMIVTEWPMQSTIPNFWSMIYDHDCSTVVVLNNPPIPSKVTRGNKSFVRFWPEDGYASYGPVFSINTVDTKNTSDFNMWQFRLGKKEIAPHRAGGGGGKFQAMTMLDDKLRKQKENNNLRSNSTSSLSAMLLQGLEAPAKLVRLYQVDGWPQEMTDDKNSDVLLNIMGDVEQWHESIRENHKNSDGSSNHPNRIAVVSCDGMARAGVYCATFTAIEQVASTKKVDIFNAVKCVRKSRPQLVESIQEYLIIHKSVKQFISNIS